MELYPDRKALDAGYERAVGNADVPASTGDCATEGDAEHRYPITDRAKGRVLCYSAGPMTTVLWTDDSRSTVSRIETPTDDLRALRDSWASLMNQADPFPTEGERRLIDLPVATECTRAGVEELDDFAGAVAAVTCAGTGGAGAQSVTYFQFDSPDALTATMTGHIPGDKDPTAPGCEDGKAPRFTGGRRYDLRSVSIGVLLCRPAPDGNVVMEWSVEPLKFAGRAVGTDPAQLAEWWRWRRNPLTERVVTALNGDSGFPDAAERALLDRIPPRSRHLCMRPSGEFRTEHVGTYPVTAGVVCGPRIGPAVLFYYQFQSKEDLRRNYGSARATRERCTDSPTSVTGESAYSRGAATGWLRCEDRDGYLARIWTDERRLIHAFAFQGRDARAMSDWWENDAGPL
jgi:hypothetical protein